MEKPGSRYDRRYHYPDATYSLEETMLVVIANTDIVTRNLLKRMRDTARRRGYKWNAIRVDWRRQREWELKMYSFINDDTGGNPH